ncbi:MAG: glutathione peroxidase [Myxococcota bacterium]|jgi:glutathione peroxidase|nr:glutathione peroxidase [Myxococcota bacterium]
MHTLYDVEVETIEGTKKTLRELEGKVALIVNTASQCGFTPQFAGLESLYGRFKDRGLVVLGFPCNQFGGQDPGSHEEISSFCQKNYGVSFPMHAKVEVNGADAHPLFVQLKKSAPGLLGSERIKWNFTKFLVDTRGRVVKRYAPTTKPEDIARDIEVLLPTR